jgi:hypothetical protein
MHAVAAATVAVTLIHFVVAPKLHGAPYWAFQTSSLSFSFGCLAILSRQLGRLRRQQSEAVAEAVGGPCDGQRIGLPPGDPPPQIWLAQPDAGEIHYLYLREVTATRRETRYVYEASPPRRERQPSDTP